MELKDYIEKYWKYEIKEKWDFLFKKDKYNNNLYYIITWEVLLSINWNNIALVKNNEILWEKSFLELTWKPINALVESRTEYFVLEIDFFNKFSNKEKIDFLKELTLFVSNRVYLLNAIVQNISYISSNVLSIKWDISFEYIKKILSKVFKLKNILVYKHINDGLVLIFESSYNPNIIKYIDSYRNNNFYILEKSKYLIKIGNYSVFLEWDIVWSEYVMNNVILNSMPSFLYLSTLLENQKDINLETFLE